MRCRGSATVEASFVVPTVIFAVFAVIIFCFCMCDRLHTENEVSMLYEHEREQYLLSRAFDETEAERFLSRRLADGYIICEPYESVRKLSDDTFEVTVCLQLKNLPFKQLRDYLSAADCFCYSQTFVMPDREKLARRYDLVVRMIEKAGKDE